MKLTDNLGTLAGVLSSAEGLQTALGKLSAVVVGSSVSNNLAIESCRAEIDDLRKSLAHGIEALAVHSLAIITESHARKAK